ncbi:hypothetical protein [Streptomyces sp. NBC_00986]|uniref:hypothetical protein n=1 Tax=Streptomyces sp. NBC_00986 TaxID=2903702 RepID=UPI00386548B3|nr:hypothetical protein OG504_46850 [Streptomyces sp. NBC_00986]
MGREPSERRSHGVVPTSVTDQSAARVAEPLDTLAAAADRGVPDANRPPEPVRIAPRRPGTPDNPHVTLAREPLLRRAPTR